jgi:hypothetical protein
VKLWIILQNSLPYVKGLSSLLSLSIINLQALQW